MKKVSKFLLSATALDVAMLSFGAFNSAKAAASEVTVNVCAGSGKDCVLWGLIEKGKGRGDVEVIINL